MKRKLARDLIPGDIILSRHNAVYEVTGLASTHGHYFWCDMIRTIPGRDKNMVWIEEKGRMVDGDLEEDRVINRADEEETP